MVSYFGTAWAGLSVFIGAAGLMVPYPPYLDSEGWKYKKTGKPVDEDV